MPLPCRIEISTAWTPEPPSEWEPQKPFVAQPAFQPVVLYVPSAAGNATDEDGAVLSIRNVRDGPASVFWASSRARTWTVYWPSAGKLDAGNASDQLPPASPADWYVSVPAENELPFQ